MQQARSLLVVVLRPQFLVGIAALLISLYGFLAPSAKHLPIPNAPGMHTNPMTPQVFGVFTTIPGRPVVPSVNCAVQACLALTFDDGPNVVTTPQVLDTLARHHARATFFVLGTHVAGNEQLLRRMYLEGHEVGNHSWGHQDFTTLHPDQIHQQIERTQAAVAATGIPAPTLFRPPYGAMNTAVRAQVPLTFALWNVDPEDWRSKHPSDIIAKVEAHALPGRVVDLHDIHQPTADSLDQLLTDLQQHYQLVTFSEMFDLVPGQPGVFYGR